MANNPILFNAALAGVTGGINQRWLTNSNPAAYLNVRAQIITFATAVDSVIATDPTVTEQDGKLIQSICQQVFAGRYPLAGNLTLVNAQPIALAIKALYDTMRGSLEPVSGGGSLTRLNNTWYADPDTTVALADQDGNIETPFATLAQAIAAADADPGSSFFKQVIAVGSFTENVVCTSFIKLTSISKTARFEIDGTLELQGNISVSLYGASVSGVVSFTSPTPTLVAEACAFSDEITDGGVGNGSASLKDCSLSGDVTLQNCSLENTTSNSSVNLAAGTTTWKNSTVLGISNVQEIIANDCTFAIINTAGNAELNRCLVDVSATFNASLFEAKDTTFNGAFTATLTRLFDCTLNNGCTVSQMEASNTKLKAVDINDTTDSFFKVCDFSAGAPPSVNGPDGSTVEFDDDSYSNFLANSGVLNSTAAMGIKLIVSEFAPIDSHYYDFEDDFDYIGNINGGTISTGGSTLLTGSGTWSMISSGAAGTLALGLAPVASHPGICGVRTNVAANSPVAITRGHAQSSFNQPFMIASDLARYCWIGRIPTALTTMAVQFGMRQAASMLVAAVSAIYFEYDSASGVSGANWLCVCANASTPTVVDSLVPVVQNQFYTLEWQRWGDKVFFFIDGVSVTPGGITTNVPGAVAVNWGMMAMSVAGAVRGFDVDKCWAQSKRLSR